MRQFAMGTLVAFAALTVGLPARATLVQWQYEGAFTSIDPGQGSTPWAPDSSEIAAGKTFSILVSFDSDAVLNGKKLDPTDGSGYRYLYSNATLSYLITAGSFVGTVSGGDPQNIIVRDGYAVDQSNLASPSVDGITFSIKRLNDDFVDGTDIDASFSLGLRNLDLNALTVIGDKMPTSPIAIVPDMQANFFQFCRSTSGSTDCAWGAVNGVFTSVTAVPEPSTYALMALGLGVIGIATRRRTRVAA